MLTEAESVDSGQWMVVSIAVAAIIGHHADSFSLGFVFHDSDRTNCAAQGA